MIHYKSDGIFDASLEKIWRYMATDEHTHAAFKSFKILNESGNEVSFEAEIFGPDGKTTQKAIIKHTMNAPKGFATSMTGGPMDGANFRHTYIAMGEKTKVEMEGDFKPIPGMDEATQTKMIDEFFSTAFKEDNENLKKFK